MPQLSGHRVVPSVVGNVVGDGAFWPRPRVEFTGACARRVRWRQQVGRAQERPGRALQLRQGVARTEQDLGNHRVATSKINSGNVNQLGVAWTIPIKGGGTFGNYASTPIVAD